MRGFYILLVAATAFIASSEALSLTTDFDRTKLTSMSRNTAKAKRVLRTDKVDNDEEERGNNWANIFSIGRTKAEAVDVMTDWITSGASIKRVAGQLKVHSYNQENKNWKALVKYVKMKHESVMGGQISRTQAEKYLRGMFNGN